MNLKKRNEINIFQSIYKKKLKIIILKKKKLKYFSTEYVILLIKYFILIYKFFT
jgi:hypothetical protein